MKRGRKKTFPAIARLSKVAREVVEQAFLQGPGVRSIPSIIKEVEEKTGEKVDDNALYRFYEFWSDTERPFIEARREADAMLAALKNSPTGEAEELIRQRIEIAQLLTAKRLDESDPIELMYLANSGKRVEVQRERNRLLKERTDNDRQKIKLLERNLELKEKQLKATAEKADGAAKKIDEIGKKKGLDSETLKKIREEVYGIVEAPV